MDTFKTGLRMKTLVALAPAVGLCLIFFGTSLETASYFRLVATPLSIGRAPSA